jgi:hypothetical protein
MSPPPRLPIDNMETRHRGLTAGVANSYHEAARTCLDRHHVSPTEFTVQGTTKFQEQQTIVEWVPTSDRERHAHGNEIAATEWGAYCCVLAAAELFGNYFAVRRAEQGTGADYYVGPAGAGEHDLEDCYRLEVSGTDAGDLSQLRSLLKEKVQQALNGRGSLPAIAGVIGFKVKHVLFAPKIETP